MKPSIHTTEPIHRGDKWAGLGEFQILLETGDPISALATAATDLLTAVGHGLANGDPVVIATTAGGLTAALDYYVIAAADDTFKLALEPDGAAVDLTAAVTHSVQPLAPPAVDLVDARIQFRLGEKTGAVVLELTVENEAIEIVDAARWILRIPAQPGPTRAGELYWDLETYGEGDTLPTTYVEGLQIVEQDVTRVTAPAS